MPNTLDDRLNALAREDLRAPLDGIEDGVWEAVRRRRAAGGADSAGIRVALTVAALAMGLAFGTMNTVKPTPLSEMGVLSEDGLLAPSIRLGGGA